MEIIGWVGAAFLALCGIPQMIKSIKDGHADGIADLFIIMWGVGEVLMFIYVLPIMSYPLLANYLLNILIIAVILKYKVFPRKKLT